jgi:hypothetical protein
VTDGKGGCTNAVETTTSFFSFPWRCHSSLHSSTSDRVGACAAHRERTVHQRAGALGYPSGQRDAVGASFARSGHARSGQLRHASIAARAKQRLSPPPTPLFCKHPDRLALADSPLTPSARAERRCETRRLRGHAGPDTTLRIAPDQSQTSLRPVSEYLPRIKDSMQAS